MTDTNRAARPFDALLAYARTYFHPEIYYGAIDEIKELCARPVEEQPARTRQFKFEVA